MKQDKRAQCVDSCLYTRLYDISSKPNLRQTARVSSVDSSISGISSQWMRSWDSGCRIISQRDHVMGLAAIFLIWEESSMCEESENTVDRQTPWEVTRVGRQSLGFSCCLPAFRHCVCKVCAESLIRTRRSESTAVQDVSENDYGTYQQVDYCKNQVFFWLRC